MTDQQQTGGTAEYQSPRELVETYLNQVPASTEIDAERRALLQDKIKALLIEKNAVLIAHYYTDPLIQALAEETGGTVSDSLEMARFGNSHKAETLVVAGVKFMGETAKILTPDKRVLMPTSGGDLLPGRGLSHADEFAAFCDQHPDRTVVVYANTSAAVKAQGRLGGDLQHCGRRGGLSGCAWARRFSGLRTNIWVPMCKKIPVPIC